MITIVDYNAGNIHSVRRAFAYLGIESEISGDPTRIKNAERIVFPGVGHARAAMDNLNPSGMAEALREAYAKGTPILGICLGMQIMLSFSEEGDVNCLNLLDGQVRHLALDGLKVPHMGFNTLNRKRDHFVFDGINLDAKAPSEFYFVHSYYADTDEKNVLATCVYGKEFPVALGCKNLVALQFHPEKSGPPGLKILQNFSCWEYK